MNGRQALRTIRALAGQGLVVFSDHAVKRVLHKGFRFADVVHSLAHARSCKWQPEHQTWKVKGCDADGLEIVSAVVVHGSALIATVFD